MKRHILLVVLLVGTLSLSGCGPRVSGFSENQLSQAMAQQQNQHERMAAALELGRRGGQRSAAILMQYVNDPNPDVQIKVMHALAVYMYDRKAAPAIEQQMFSPHESVARKAISCIKHLDYSAAVPDLKRLRDTSTMPGVVRAAQNAIVYFRRHG